MIAELWHRDRVLAWTGAIHALLAVLFLLAMPFDSREILGIDPWVKPFKFAASIALFTWTLAWYMGDWPAPRVPKRIVSFGVAIAMLVEIVCIAGQSARGTTSHFNSATALDGMVFATMGAMIGLNTLLVLMFLLLHLRWPPADRPASYVWGVRLGTLLLLTASAQGGVMLTNGAHSVGLVDGGPGLPLVNWSTQGGDLRIAHLLGLHAFQAIPFVGWLVGRDGKLPAAVQVSLTFAFALLWSAMMAVMLTRALEGKPLIAG